LVKSDFAIKITAASPDAIIHPKKSVVRAHDGKGARKKSRATIASNPIRTTLAVLSKPRMS
jgi:hypothetical protein|tara:strand:- start:828 stop:1010 length:183 start_codon:yes stop_codon:yes gene_type:complete